MVPFTERMALCCTRSLRYSITGSFSFAILLIISKYSFFTETTMSASFKTDKPSKKSAFKKSFSYSSISLLIKTSAYNPS